MVYSSVISRAQETSKLSAQFHAATAELALRLAELDDSREWHGDGFRSCAHWLSIHAGFASWTADDLIRVGRAIRDLPKIGAAFAEGQLSLDKVRSLVAVATPPDEHVWLEVALAASTAQLARICQAFRRASVVEDPEHHAAQQAKRTFNAWWQEDGMLRLVATLPPVEGRIVLNAVEDAVISTTAPDTEKAERPPTDVFGARRADALTRLSEHWLSGNRDRGATKKAPRQVVVHVDIETLLAKNVDGRCHIEDGPAVSAAMARRLCCDSDVLTMLERGATTLDLFRTRRTATGRLRRAVQLRDGFCRYPGCRAPACDTEAHHILDWLYGGLTELGNLVSLCGFHHQRLHEGAFQIVVIGTGEFEFFTALGEPIQSAPRPLVAPDFDGARWLHQLAALAGRTIDAETPSALGHGGRFDTGLATEVISHNVALAAARAEPP